MRIAFYLIALFGLVALAWAGEPSVSGIYSNLSYNEEGGDLLGTELLILPSADNAAGGYSVFVQIAEGGAPFTAIVPVKISGNTIEFILPPGGAYDRQRFVGFVETGQLILRWSNGTEEHLKRGKSYWQ
jgi:hypothetical protein